MFEIREIKENEFDELLILIDELAEYENLSDEIKFNKIEFKKNIFEKNYAKCLVCMIDDKMVAYAFYFITFSTFLGKGGIFLEDLYVREEYRKMGIATKIFEKLIQICKDNGFGRIDWDCLNTNELGINFYEKLGAKHLKIWRKYRLCEDDFDNLLNKGKK